MKVVRFNKSGGAVTIKITVTGVVAWRYLYLADDKKFVGTTGTPNSHALGMPVELHLDYNKWDFRLGNVSDDKQDYHIVIIWKQDGSQIDMWENGGSLTADNPVKLVTDDCLLMER